MGRSHVHDERHHHADRARDAGRIVEEFVDRFVASAFRIPGKSFEQGLGQRGGNGAPAHEVGHCAIRGVWLRAPPRGAGEAVAQSVQRVLRAAAEVDRIVRQAAKGVEREGPLARLRGQEPRGGVKRLRSVPDGAAAFPMIAQAREIKRKLRHEAQPCRERGPRTARRAVRRRDACRPRREKDCARPRSHCEDGTRRSA